MATDDQNGGTQDGKFKMPWPSTPSFIANALVLAMIVLTFTMLFVKPPDSDVFKMLAGGLMTVGFATIISFYFGSSAGSKAKDDAIQSMAAASTGTGNGHVAEPTRPAATSGATQ